MTVPSDVSCTVDAGRLSTGGLATALVAALIAVVGVMIARGLFGVPVLAPDRKGTLGDASTFRLAALAAGRPGGALSTSRRGWSGRGRAARRAQRRPSAPPP